MRTVRELIEAGEFYAAERAVRLARINEIKTRLDLLYTQKWLRAEQDGWGYPRRRLYTYEPWML